MIEIPIGTAAAQVFTVALEGQKITMRLRYLHLPDRWNMTLERDGATILAGQRMVVGTDLLGSFNFGLGGLFCVDGSGEGIDPGREDFVDRVRLIHISEAEIAAISP